MRHGNAGYQTKVKELNANIDTSRIARDQKKTIERSLSRRKAKYRWRLLFVSKRWKVLNTLCGMCLEELLTYTANPIQFQRRDDRTNAFRDSVVKRLPVRSWGLRQNVLNY